MLISVVFIALAIPIRLKMSGMVRMFLSGLPPNLKVLLDALEWLFLVKNMRLFSYYLELKRAMLHPSQACRELRLLPKDIGSFVDSNLESTMVGILPLRVG